MLSNMICFGKRIYRELGIGELLAGLIFDISMVVDKHVIYEYNSKLYDVDIELKQFGGNRQRIARSRNTWQHTGDGQAIRAKHRLRHAESDLAVEAFEAWLGRHIGESQANAFRSFFSRLYSDTVGSVPVDEMAEFNAMMDQQERFMHSLANMNDQLADGRIVMPDDTAAMVHELVLYGDADKISIADQFKQITQGVVNMYPEPVSGDDCGSTLMVDDGNSNEGRIDMSCDDQDDLMTSNMSKTEFKKMFGVVITDIKNNI